MNSFLTPEAISISIGVIVILISITYAKLEDVNVSATQRFYISVSASLLVLAILALVWTMLYGVIILLTNQEPDGFYTLTSGIAGVVFIILSFIISREIINRVIKRWSG